MKKLFVALTVLTLVFASCTEKEEVTPNNGSEQKEEVNSLFLGDWTFVSVEFEGGVYSGCDNPQINDYTLPTLDLTDVTETSLTSANGCFNYSINSPYSLVDDVLNINDGIIIFNVISLTENELIIELIETAAGKGFMIGAVYTLTK